MKITAVLGSPRTKGNSATIVAMVLESLQKAGPQTRIFELNRMSYRGCQACMACKTASETCVVRDDLSPVLEEITISDVVLIASPIYMWEVTGQMKGFIDRCYSYLKPDFRTNPLPGRLNPGKKLVFILSQGNPDEAMYADIVLRHTNMFKRLGFSEIYPIRAVGAGPQSEVNRNSAILESVARTAAGILAS